MFAKMLKIASVSAVVFILLLALFLVIGNTAKASPEAGILYVAPGASCSGMSPCYAQVQEAVLAAGSGDEIRVAEGVYHIASAVGGHSQVAYINKNVTLRGGYDLNSWEFDPENNLSILDAQGMGRPIYIEGNFSPTVEGFHLVNGIAAEGGGVYIQGGYGLLQHNVITGNHADYAGGGIYLDNSSTTIQDNQVLTNTVGISGHGGGISLLNSPAVLSSNVISDNTAYLGGGVYLQNYVSGRYANLKDNLIQGNKAIDKPGYDGAGGGVYIGSSSADALTNNIILKNSAKRGGGINISFSPAVVFSNTLQENTASYHGGGLYVQGSGMSLVGNQVLTNTAEEWGGGMCFGGDKGNFRRNRFQGNIAHNQGGGLYTTSAAIFDSNLFLDNQADNQGGGIFVVKDENSAYQNTVIVGNSASVAGALYLWGAVTSFSNSTISDNPSTDGNAVVMISYPGYPNVIPCDVVFTNTIVSTQTVGISAGELTTVTVSGVLWDNMGTNIAAPLADVEVNAEYTGDPLFMEDGYHLKNEDSAATGKGWVTELDHDVDGKLVFAGEDQNLGADNLPHIYEASPNEVLQFQAEIESLKIQYGMDAPPGSFDDNMEVGVELYNADYPCGCPQSSNAYWLGCPLGPTPLELEFCKMELWPNGEFLYDPEMTQIEVIPYENDFPLDFWPFSEPGTLIFSYLESFLNGADESRLDVLTNSEPGLPTGEWKRPDCGPIVQDMEANTVEVPICHLSRYVFGVRPAKVFLPILMR